MCVSVREHVCVCEREFTERERESERVCQRESVCVSERASEYTSACVCE